jgi:hypothetical protein
MFIGQPLSDAQLNVKFGRTLAKRLRVLGFNADGGLQRQRLAHMRKHLGSHELTTRGDVEMAMAKLMVEDILLKMRVALERQIDANSDASKRTVPKFTNLTPFFYLPNGATLAAAAVDKSISKGLRDILRDATLRGLMFNPWTNDLQVLRHTKQAASKKRKRPLDGYVTNDELRAERDADDFLSDNIVAPQIGADAGAAEGATFKLALAVVDKVVPPAKRQNCTVLLPDEFTALKRARFLVLHGGAQALGVDPNVGTLVFATPGGGPYEKINSFTVKLSLLNRKRAGSVMQRQAAKLRQRRVADEMARRLAAALLVAPDDNSPPADVVVYVGNAFKNQTMKNARGVGGYAAGEVFFAALRRLPRFRFTIVYVPEPFTTRVTVYDK